VTTTTLQPRRLPPLPKRIHSIS